MIKSSLTALVRQQLETALRASSGRSAHSLEAVEDSAVLLTVATRG